MAIRLAKYIADCGYCSRKQASRLIEQGIVSVNGRLANHIDHVNDSDVITISNEILKPNPNKVYYAFNKPIDIDCKLIPSDPKSLIHLLPQQVRVFPIGRLDKDSHGLLLLTNDGDFYHQLNHPEHHQEKEYLVTVNKVLTDDFCIKMASGIPVKGKITKPCKVIKVASCQFKITLTQGLNRQIRRMAKHLGYFVCELQRIRVANIELEKLNLALGQFKEITRKDILESERRD